MADQEAKLAAVGVKEESAAVIVADSSLVTIIDPAPSHERIRHIEQPSLSLDLDQDTLGSLPLTQVTKIIHSSMLDWKPRN